MSEETARKERKSLRFLLLLVALLLQSRLSEALERFEIVTTRELQQLLAERTRGESDFLLVNTVDDIVFRHSSIPGSINLPPPKVQEAVQLLGANPERLVIMY